MKSGDTLTDSCTKTFVLSHEDEAKYLAACPPLLRHVASIMLDTGLRIGELLNLRWEDIRFEPTGAAKFGSVKIRSGKSQNAIRTLYLTVRASAVLFARRNVSKSPHVFPGRSAETAMLVRSMNHLHRRVRVQTPKGKKHQAVSEELRVSERPEPMRLQS